MTKLKGNLSVAKQMYSILKNAYYIPKQSQETYPNDARLPQCHITVASTIPGFCYEHQGTFESIFW